MGSSFFAFLAAAGMGWCCHARPYIVIAWMLHIRGTSPGLSSAGARLALGGWVCFMCAKVITSGDSARLSAAIAVGLGDAPSGCRATGAGALAAAWAADAWGGWDGNVILRLPKPMSDGDKTTFSCHKYMPPPAIKHDPPRKQQTGP